MKTAFFVLIFDLLILGQSVIFFQPGTHLTVEVGANIIAGSAIINGTFSGGGTINGLPIPVELVFFRAEIADNSVTLEWQTATETNNKGFEIQKSFSGRQAAVSAWEVIGFAEGAGTTTDQQNYLYADENLSNGKYSYRLKQIDYDGSFSYSNEVEVVVDIPYEFSLSQNYPNPFNPSTKIKFSIPSLSIWERVSEGRVRATLKVFDILGNEVATLVNEEKESGAYEVEWNASKVSSGIYYYRITAGTFVETKRMIYLK